MRRVIWGPVILRRKGGRRHFAVTVETDYDGGPPVVCCVLRPWWHLWLWLRPAPGYVTIPSTVFDAGVRGAGIGGRR